MRVEPSGKTILQGSILSTVIQLPESPKGTTHVKGSARYSENILATILLTIRDWGECFIELHELCSGVHCFPDQEV
jgi:hypothetical protein